MLTSYRDLEGVYKEKESRLRSLHQEEIDDLTHRLRVANDRLVAAKADHEDEMEAERERRVKDLARQSEEHTRAVEALRTEYLDALDKVKEIRAREINSLKDATDVTRYGCLSKKNNLHIIASFTPQVG